MARKTDFERRDGCTHFVGRAVIDETGWIREVLYQGYTTNLVLVCKTLGSGGGECTVSYDTNNSWFMLVNANDGFRQYVNLQDATEVCTQLENWGVETSDTFDKVRNFKDWFYRGGKVCEDDEHFAVTVYWYNSGCTRTYVIQIRRRDSIQSYDWSNYKQLEGNAEQIKQVCESDPELQAVCKTLLSMMPKLKKRKSSKRTN